MGSLTSCSKSIISAERLRREQGAVDVRAVAPTTVFEVKN